MKKKIIFTLFIFIQFINSYSYAGVLNKQSMNSTSAKNANPDFIYISPLPGSSFNLPRTNIIIKSKNLLDISSANQNNILSVNGTQSGTHSGKISVADDGRTILFNPDIAFSNGETVNVTLNEGLKNSFGTQIGGLSFDFSISTDNTPPLNAFEIMTKEFRNIPAGYNTLTSKTLQKNSSVKSTLSVNVPNDFPNFSISESAQSPGFVFMDNNNWNPSVLNQPFIMILDNTGAPFFYKRIPENALDLKLQPNGLITYYDGSKGFYCGMDSTFTVVDSFSCGNGYITDMHDIQLLTNGHFLLIGDDYEQIDMSQVVPGGNPKAQVVGIVVQELDRNKNVVFQWRSLDHFQITDATSDIDLAAATVDYVHSNAITMDKDGNLMLSSRNLDEITKINRQTGDIIWRLGGKNNRFSLLNDNVWFSHQHDIRRLANGNISLFDDGNLHWSIAPSRAVEYNLDEANKTVSLVWSFENDNEYSGAMGNVQRLSNGNTMIGWGGGSPSVTEVTPAGQKVYELTLSPNIYSYRAYRFNLSKGYYTSFVPNLISPANNTSANNQLTLTWNKNKFAQSFHLQVAKDSLFTNLICDNSSLIDTTFTLTLLEPGTKYYWHVLSSNNTENTGGYSGYSDTWNFNYTGTSSVASNNNLPVSYAIFQNYPNPFNPATNIKYDIPKPSIVKIKIYDELGEEVKTLVNEEEQPGSYQVTFEGEKLASGIYFYNIEADDLSNNSAPVYYQTKKMILIK